MLRLLTTFLQGGHLAVFHEFHRPPYGGGNQFLLALKSELERQGLRVSKNRAGARTQAVLFNSFNFDFDEIKRLRSKPLVMIHRVDGPIGIYRGTDLEVDEKIFKTNQEVADATIFQSRYSLEKHEELGFYFKRATVIPNAVNGGIFFPKLDARLSGGRVRVVGTAWSSNPKKGLAAYEWLDENLDFSRFEVTFVGRIQAKLRNIRVLPAIPSEALGAFLREQDIYLAPSESDPCSNALIEALASGLPAAYRKSGGHPELVGEGGLGFDSPEEIPGALEKIASHWDVYRRGIRVASIAEAAAAYRAVMKL